MAQNTTTVGRLPRIIEAQASVTRPADTTAYAAGDAISDNATTATAAGYFALTFGAEAGGGIELTDITLHKSDHDTTNATFWLLLFDTPPAFAGWEDNAQLAITSTEMLNCKCTVQFLTGAGAWINVVTGDVQTTNYSNFGRQGVVFASGSRTLYGILVAGAAYTPASGEVFTITAHARQE